MSLAEMAELCWANFWAGDFQTGDVVRGPPPPLFPPPAAAAYDALQARMAAATSRQAATTAPAVD